MPGIAEFNQNPRLASADKKNSSNPSLKGKVSIGARQLQFENLNQRNKDRFVARRRIDLVGEDTI